MFTAAHGAGNRRRGGAFFQRPAVKFRGLIGAKESVVKARNGPWFLFEAEFVEPGEVIV
jgi:hypothetical protein